MEGEIYQVKNQSNQDPLNFPIKLNNKIAALQGVIESADVRPTEQARLAAAGHRMRVYVPYGDEWYGYMVRRMAEKPANMALFFKAITSKA